MVPACGSCISWGEPQETSGWHRVVPLGLVPGVPSRSPVEPRGAAGCLLLPSFPADSYAG